MSSVFKVTDTRPDPGAQYSSLGGGRVAAGSGSRLGSFVTQSAVSAGAYKTYQLSGFLDAADLAASTETYVRLDTTGATPLGRDETISIISAYARLENPTAGAGTIELGAQYLYEDTSFNTILEFSNTFLAGTINDIATIGSDITFGSHGGPNGSVNRKFNGVYAEPTLVFRRQGTVTDATFGFQINFIVVPGTRYVD